MEFFLIAIFSFAGSAITLFSGFGLGTILLPVFVLLFPGKTEEAVALTAIVHLLNNSFKMTLLHRNVNRNVLLRFGLPALIAAIPGALLLKSMDHFEPLGYWQLGGSPVAMFPVDMILGILIVLFAMMELFPVGGRLGFRNNHWFVGGILSGFFGGLSGHQGALRSVFLSRSGLSREEFIGTGIAIALLVDIGRLFVYSESFLGELSGKEWPLLIVAILSAFTGALLGKFAMKKVTWKFMRISIGSLLFLIGLGLISGLLRALRTGEVSLP